MTNRETGAGQGRVLLVEDDSSLRSLLAEELTDAGFDVLAVANAEAAWPHLATGEVRLVISDLRLPGIDGLTLLRQVQQMPAAPGFLMITAFGTIDQAVTALKEGADEFLVKPVDLDHLLLCVRRVSESRRLREEVVHYRKLLGGSDFHGMIGRSPVMHLLYGQIQKIARADGPVLITGESGVGKELVTRALHQESDRARGPLVPVNCAGLPVDLLESELFGHTSGAFTGAQRARQGLLAEAHGGTLLLDEIGELPLGMQAKLLRALQDRRIRPVGANREQTVDVRVVAATNRDLQSEVASGGFREDLFYRLNTFALEVPPLRQRGEDLALLAANFIGRFSAQLGHEIIGLNNEALGLLENYPFPGNVRELANVIERAVTFCSEREITPAHLPEHVRQSTVGDRTASLPRTFFDSTQQLPALHEVEQRYIHHVLEHVNGNKRRAAEILGIGRRTLYRYLEPDDKRRV